MLMWVALGEVAVDVGENAVPALISVVPERAETDVDEESFVSSPRLDPAKIVALGLNPDLVNNRHIAELEDYKLATPESDADRLGGTTKLRFFPIFTRDKPSLTIEGMTLVNSLGRSPGYSGMVQATHPDMVRFWGGRFGVLVSASSERQSFGKEFIGRDWFYRVDGAGERRRFVEKAFLERESQNRIRHTASINGDLDLGNGLFAYIKSYWRQTDSAYLNRNIDYRFKEGTFVDGDGPEGIVEKGRIIRAVEDRKFRAVYQSMTAGIRAEKELWTAELQGSWRSNASGWERQFDSFFDQGDIKIAYRDAEGRKMRLGAEDRVQEVNAAAYGFDQFREMENEDTSVDSIVNADWVRKWRMNKGQLDLRVGAKFFDRSFRSEESRKNHFSYDGGLEMDQVSDAWRDPGFAGGDYAMEGFPSASGMADLYRSNPVAFVWDETSSRMQSDPANYEISEQVGAAYVVGNYQRGSVRTMLGVRYEETNDTFNGKEVWVDADNRYDRTVDTEGSKHYANHFPGLQLAWDVTSKLTLYGGWSKALKRPNYDYLAPFRRISMRSQDITEGNPDLEPEIYTNALLALDWTYASDGFFGIEWLMRNYDDIILRTRTILGEEDVYTGFRKNTWINGGNGTLNRLDLEWYQGFGFFSRELRPLSIRLKYSFSKSENLMASLGGKERLPMLRMPREKASANLVWRGRKWIYQVDLVYWSRQLRVVGGSSDLHEYSFGELHVNAKMEYRWKREVAFLFQVENLTRESYLSFVGSRAFLLDGIHSGQVWKTGLRLRF